LPKNRAHLLHAQSDFPPALFARIAKHRKMRGVDFDPLRLILGEDRLRDEEVQRSRHSEQRDHSQGGASNRNRAEVSHGRA
jgi:hypothetical protein